MQTDTPRFKQWIAAEKEAQAAERELHAAMLRFAENTAGAPVAELVQATRDKRRRAHELFEGAMQELKDLAASLDHRKITTSAAVRLQQLPATHQRPGEPAPPLRMTFPRD